MEHAVPAIGPHGKRLGAILESVGWRLDTLITHAQRVTLFGQDKLGIGPATRDGICRHIPSHAEMTGIGLVAHSLQFANRDVVALVSLDAANRKIDDGAQNDDSCGTDAKCLPRDFHGLYKGRSPWSLPPRAASERIILL